MRAVTLLFFACSVFLLANHVSSHDNMTYIHCLDGTEVSWIDCSRYGMPELINSAITESFTMDTISGTKNSTMQFTTSCSSITMDGFPALDISRITTLSYSESFRILFDVTIPNIMSIAECYVKSKSQDQRRRQKEVLTATHVNVKARVIIELPRSMKIGPKQLHVKSLKINPDNLFAHWITTERTAPGSAFDPSTSASMIETMNAAIEPLLRNHFKKSLRKALDMLLNKFNTPSVSSCA